MNPPYGDLLLSGVSIPANVNLDILGVKFDSKLTFKDLVRDILSRVSQRIGIMMLVKCINFVDTSVLLRCYFVFVLRILEIVLRCGSQLLNVIFSLLSARCIRWPGFALIRVSRRCVIDVVLLRLICCTRLLGTLITVCSASFHLLLLKFDISELRPQLNHWSLKYQGLERPNLQAASCRPRFECGMTFPTVCLTPEPWMGSKVQSTVGCFPELCFLQFPASLVLVGLRKQFINNFFFPLSGLGCWF